MFRRKDKLIKRGFTQRRKVGKEAKVVFAYFVRLHKTFFFATDSQIFMDFLCKSVNLWLK